MGRSILIGIGVLGFLLAAESIAAAAIRPEKLTCEYLVDPLGSDVLQPRLSWSFAAQASQPAFGIFFWVRV